MEVDNKTLQKYLAEVRRVEKSRSEGAEKEIRKLYKGLLKDLVGFVGEYYTKYSDDEGILSAAILQQKAKYASFLEEVDRNIKEITPEVSKTIKKTVEDTYKACYKGMVKALTGAADSEKVKESFKGLSIKPEVMKAAVENPISGLTLPERLEKNRNEVIYDIKQNITNALMTGERYDTTAKKIAERLDISYGKAVRIVRTESHRVEEKGLMDGAEDINEKVRSDGLVYAVIWRNMGDGKVRPYSKVHTSKGWKTYKSKTHADHVKMEGQIIEAGGYFDLGHGVKARSPGESGDAANDINCRCFIEYEMMTEEEFIERGGKLKEREEKDVEKADESGIIKVEKSLENYDEYSKAWIDKNFNSISDSQKEFLKETIDTIVDKNDFSMMVDSDVLQDVINKGFLNQFETGKSGGSLNPEWRRAATKQLFGADVDNMEPSEFEKYGFLGSKNTYESFKSFGTSQYGDVLVKFKKDNLIDRTTYTIDDSLGLALNQRIIGGKIGVDSNIGGVRVDEIKHIAESFMFMNEDKFDNATKVAQSLGGRYWELQYHGKLTIEDVESMTFKTKPDEEVVRKLKEKNVSVYVLNKRSKGTDEI